MDIKTIKARLSTSLDISQLLPIQQNMAQLKLPGKVLLCAPTGSGKTVAFAIALLRSLKQAGKGVQALVLAPTRELALQIFEVLRPLAAPGYKTAALYGGHSFEAESRSLEGNPDIVIGTPGRILDHIRRGLLSLFGVTCLVIDEYDKALELGFRQEMSAIVGRLKNAETMVLTSATKGEIPQFVSAVDRTLDYSESPSATMPDIELFEVLSPAADKLDTLVDLLRTFDNRRCIVFVNHRDAAERVYKHLKRLGFPAGLYHGGLEQQLRQRALILFDNGTTPILVSTDLASRGLDIEQVEAVVHYHLPASAEAWTHRNGRTARMGASGSAYVIISDHDKVPDFLPALQDYIPGEQHDILPSAVATLYFNAGRKEKISKGDVVGFIINKGGLTAAEVGRIDVLDHCVYVAVPAVKARATALALAPHRIKNVRVRVSQLKED